MSARKAFLPRISPDIKFQPISEILGESIRYSHIAQIETTHTCVAVKGAAAGDLQKELEVLFEGHNKVEARTPRRFLQLLVTCVKPRLAILMLRDGRRIPEPPIS